MSSELIASLGRAARRAEGALRPRDAEDFPWLFEPYWEADLDLAIERASLRRVFDGTLDLALVARRCRSPTRRSKGGCVPRVIRGRTAWHHSSLTYEPFQRQGIARRQLSASVRTVRLARRRPRAAQRRRPGPLRLGACRASTSPSVSSTIPRANLQRSLVSERSPSALATISARRPLVEIAGSRKKVPPGLFVARELQHSIPRLPHRLRGPTRARALPLRGRR